MNGRLTQEVFGSKMQAHSTVLSASCFPPCLQKQVDWLGERHERTPWALGLGLPVPQEVSCLLKPPTALGSNRAATVPQVLECGSGGVVGWGCWPSACVTAVSASTGLDWQGQEQY